MSTLKQEGSGQNLVSRQVGRFSRVSRKRQRARTAAGLQRDEKRILGVLIHGGLYQVIAVFTACARRFRV